jgi:SAM-dependent methyltransferase
VQGRELGFWKKTAIPLGNLQQVKAFDGFKSLPRSLGRVLEIGAGPYTKIFLMLEEAAKQGMPFEIESVSLQDPMVDTYPTEAKHCTYAAGTFCPPGHGCLEKMCVSNIPAEAINVREAFDTIVLMNVLEHCQDAPAIFNNVYNALKPGGLFVFWDRYHYDDVSVPINEAKRQRALDGFHQLHPLTFTRSFFERHLSTSYVTLLMENTANLQMTTFVGRKANHTTVSAHRSDRAKPQV